DLIGAGWQEIAKQLQKPWIACNRSADEGGSWRGTETERTAELVSAIKLGADIIDIELGTENLEKTIKLIKKNNVKCLLSFHSLVGTPPIDTLKEIAQSQFEAGADISKVVTTARNFADNLTVLQLIPEFPEQRIVAFAMGDLGLTSRILCPIIGGDFTYASISEGRESAPGQITVQGLLKIYDMLKDGQ
ncbi:type I 3-dehydroquinate dehydratase, partial [Chloroflexota bacterium]